MDKKSVLTVLVVLAVSTSTALCDSSGSMKVHGLIKEAAPHSWKERSATTEQTERTAFYFGHTRVQTLALVGPQIRYVRWVDDVGKHHILAFAKECLYFWITPPDITPRLPRKVRDGYISGPGAGYGIPALIFSSSQMSVYGLPTEYLLGEKLPSVPARRIKFDYPTISWTNWRKTSKSV